MTEKQRKLEVLTRLKEHYFGAKPALLFNNEFELLLATILSAQTTDKQVNNVTGNLFKKYTKPQDYVNITIEELGEQIKSCGFYKTKAKHLIETCEMLIDDYNSKVPETMEELIKLHGVGRKTANVVLSNAFFKPAIAVDTHVFRVSNRLGLAKAKDVLKTEEHLMKLIPKQDWGDAHHWLIWHGRKLCTARNKKCAVCFLADICPSSEK